jgi:hypothetical protein
MHLACSANMYWRLSSEVRLMRCTGRAGGKAQLAQTHVGGTRRSCNYRGSETRLLEAEHRYAGAGRYRSFLGGICLLCKEPPLTASP